MLIGLASGPIMVLGSWLGKQIVDRLPGKGIHRNHRGRADHRGRTFPGPWLRHETHSVIETWPVTVGNRNVAMAFDPTTHRLIVTCRSGAIIVINETVKQLQTLTIGTGVDGRIFDPTSTRIEAGFR